MTHFIPSYDIFSHIVASTCSHGSIIYNDLGKKFSLCSFYLLSFTIKRAFLLILVSFRNTFHYLLPHLMHQGQIVDLDKHVETPKLWF